MASARRNSCAACAALRGVDRAALADIIQKVSKLVNDFPEILEVDLNPIFATDKGAHAVDVRIVVGEPLPQRQRFTQSEILERHATDHESAFGGGDRRVGRRTARSATR
jgi:hypothetical protein